MEINHIAKLSTTMAEVGISQQVDMAVLKKAMDIEASSATALVEAIPSSAANNVPRLPPHLGRHINTSA